MGLHFKCAYDLACPIMDYLIWHVSLCYAIQIAIWISIVYVIAYRKIAIWVSHKLSSMYVHFDLCTPLTAVTGLTHWGRAAHICVSKITNIGSDNGLSPRRHQAIILTNAGMLLIRPFWTKFSKIVIEIQTISFKTMHLKMSLKWRPFCPDLNVITWSLG